MFRKKTNVEVAVYIYESEVQAIAGEAQRFPTTETGGDLFGTFTHGNMPVIWLASGPGPNAKHLPTHFEQDVFFTSKWQRHLMNNFGIQYIGSWHSHHILGLNQPSGGDRQAARSYAIHHGRQRTLEIITNHEGHKPVTSLRPYFYANAQEDGCIPATFTVLMGESPLRARLGADESVFSKNLDWRQIPRNSYLLSSFRPTRDFTEVPDSDGDLSLTPELESAIRNLECEGVEVEQRGDVFMIVIPLSAERLLAIAVQNSRDLNIAQANLIDTVQNINTNITPRLQELGISLSINKHNVSVLKAILTFVQGSEGRGEINHGRVD